MTSLLSPNSFVGRESQVAEVCKLLGAGRLVTVTGPPGVGKTRLAFEVAARLEHTYAFGMWLVTLAEVRDEGAVSQALAAALGIHESAGKDITEAVTGYLGTRHSLVVIDNAEHMLDSCRLLVERLLGDCPALSVLVTSREPLKTDGEARLVIEPLAVEPAEADGDTAPAVRLFVERARAVCPEFSLSNETLAVVTEICRHLDGLPLAIELAAARVDSVSVEEIASTLDERLDLLAKKATSGDPRHRNLRVALEWSQDLLSGDEQRLLRQLSVFDGTFTAEAAAVVTDGTPAEQAPADALAALVSKSLVVAASQRQVRYRLLETVRVFAGELLEFAGESEAIASRHAGWYTRLADAAEDELTGPDQLQALDRIDADYPDFRRALQNAVEASRHEQALRLAGGLTLYWRVRGRFTEGRRWLETALENGGKAPAGVRATALWGAGFIALMLGDQRRAVEALETSLDIASGTADRRRQARALLLLGNAHLTTGSGAGVDLLEASHAIAVEIDDTWCAAHALGLIGRVQLDSGNLPAAERTVEAAAQIARGARDAQGMRISVFVLAQLRKRQGRLKDAEALFNEASEAAKSLREPYLVTWALHGLARILLARGDPDAANQRLDEAFSTLDEGAPGERALLLVSRGEIALYQGDYEASRPLLEEAVNLFYGAGEPAGAAVALLARVMIYQDDLSAARAALHAAAPQSPSARPNSDILGAMGCLALAEGELDEAETHFLEALEMEFETHDLSATADLLTDVAIVAFRRRRYAGSIRLLAASESILAAAGYVRSRSVLKTVSSIRDEHARRAGRQRTMLLWDEGSAMSLEQAVSYAQRRQGADGRAETGWASLTRTERKVVALVAHGLPNADIGERLQLSPRTVENHLYRIFAKLGLSSRTQLALMAQERGPVAAHT